MKWIVLSLVALAMLMLAATTVSSGPPSRLGGLVISNEHQQRPAGHGQHPARPGHYRHPQPAPRVFLYPPIYVRPSYPYGYPGYYGPYYGPYYVPYQPRQSYFGFRYYGGGVGFSFRF